MPLFIDIHSCEGVSPEDVARAHMADLQVQDRYSVEYLKYWYNEACGKLFCLVDAPSAEAAICVHREAHGLVAEKLIEVDPDLVDGFLGAAAVDSGGAALLPEAAGRDPGVRTIMFTDMVGSTELTSSIGDDAALAILHIHDRIVRGALGANSGREIKHTGDGIMASFLSSACAVRCACQVQRGFLDQNEAGDAQVMVRIGLAAGEPVEENNDLFGSTVQLAARLCERANPGQVLVSSVIADLCIGKGLKFLDPDEAQLQGFATPVRTHLVELLC